MSSQDGIPSCQHLSLARSEIGHISTCRDCGVVQLHLQALSLRLEDEAFEALARMVGRASLRLAAMDRLAGEPPRGDAPGRPAGLH
ncbi:hypothetical protein [Ramlibacter sp. 2FC]|uniref:hypothetical protein n=1 Tax=Ramlibacter sp. 2FC TaxID=2502188 RepID=UPI0010F67253|nr:hypothetical protein [Ramlibacter sp. 2FC]